MYTGPVIDPHFHFWDYAMGKHPWLTPTEGGVQALGGLDKLRRNFLPADYAEAAAGQNVVATVHIEALWQAGDELGETLWIESLDKPAGYAARIIGAAPFGTDRAAGVIAAQAAVKSVAGIRAVLSFHPHEPHRSFAPRGGIGAEPAFRRDLAHLIAHDLHLELMMYHYQLADVLGFARALPDLRIVVNHCASPIDRDPAGMQAWRESLKALADCPKICLKVSNIGAYDPTLAEDSIAAVAHDCIAAFGPQRAMFATDWPVSAMHTSYAGIYDQFRRIAAGFPPADQAALFHDTAKRVYRL